jgi:hypothetical protein
LPDIAVLGLRILRRVPLAAMVLETQHPARLQCSIEVREGIWSETFMQPIVKVAKGEDQIGRAGRGNFALANAKDSWRKLAICRRIGLDLAAEEGVELVGFGVGRLAPTFPLQSDIIAAVIVQGGARISVQ